MESQRELLLQQINMYVSVLGSENARPDETRSADQLDPEHALASAVLGFVPSRLSPPRRGSHGEMMLQRLTCCRQSIPALGSH